MRVSTLALTTLTVLAAQDLYHDAGATPVPDAVPVPSSVEAAKAEGVAIEPDTNTVSSPESFVKQEFTDEAIAKPILSAPDKLTDSLPQTEGIEQPVVAIAPVNLPLPEAIAAPSLELQAPEQVLAPPALTIAQTYQAPLTTTGVSRRRVRPAQLATVRVTNRSGRRIDIELVGRTQPLSLAPGQTRQLRVDPRDLSLLYWVPGSGQQELTARVSQPSVSNISVEVFASRFPNGNMAIYMPEPDNYSDILRVF